MKRRIKGLLYLTLAGFIVYSVFYKNASKVSTYDIVQKTNYGDKLLDKLYKVKEDNRNHPIIQIVSTGENAGTCTAFVISDTAALTAAHCIKLSEDEFKYEVPKVLKKSVELERKYLEIISFLRNTCTEDDIECMRELTTNIIGLRKELAAREKVLKLKPDVYSVIDVNGLDTGLKATAYSKNKRRDYGFIRGDFKNFKKLPVRTGWHVKPGDVLRACGFFGSRLPPQCVDFKAIGNYGFHYACEGIIVPGVSGGPVIDADGYVAGIAVSAHEDFVVMVPTLGMLDIYTQEYADKLDKASKKKNKKKKKK